jgi:hypothetical protein
MTSPSWPTANTPFGFCRGNYYGEDFDTYVRDANDDILVIVQIEHIDAIRNIGNFSAHPSKNKSTGEIVEVEPQEAEWNLDVLESLFDFYFVQPAVTKAKRDALNKKLADAGKPSMKK